MAPTRVPASPSRRWTSESAASFEAMRAVADATLPETPLSWEASWPFARNEPLKAAAMVVHLAGDLEK